VKLIAEAKGFDKFFKMSYYEMITTFRGLPIRSYYGLIDDVFESERARNIIEVNGGLNSTHIYLLANEILKEKTGVGLGNQILVKVVRAMVNEGRLKIVKSGRVRVYQKV